jgi:hypothetical protein
VVVQAWWLAAAAAAAAAVAAVSVVVGWELETIEIMVQKTCNERGAILRTRRSKGAVPFEINFPNKFFSHLKSMDLPKRQ